MTREEFEKLKEELNEQYETGRTGMIVDTICAYVYKIRKNSKQMQEELENLLEEIDCCL